MKSTNCSIITFSQGKDGFDIGELAVRNSDGRLQIALYKHETNASWQAHHVYILCHDDTSIPLQIKGGDWYYDTAYKIIKQATMEMADIARISSWKELGIAKVIASTNKSLGLPTVPDAVIKKYVEAQYKVNSVTDMAEIPTTEVPCFPDVSISKHLQWLRIDPSNLPTEEVIGLAEQDKQVMSGMLEMSHGKPAVIFRGHPDDMPSMLYCNYYIPVAQLLEFPKQD